MQKLKAQIQIYAVDQIRLLTEDKLKCNWRMWQQ